MEKRKFDHVAYAARDYTEWRTPDGAVYVEWHKQEPKHKHGVKREDLTRKEK